MGLTFLRLKTFFKNFCCIRNNRNEIKTAQKKSIQKQNECCAKDNCYSPENKWRMYQYPAKPIKELKLPRVINNTNNTLSNLSDILDEGGNINAIKSRIYEVRLGQKQLDNSQKTLYR